MSNGNGKVEKVQVAKGSTPEPLIVQVMDSEGEPIDLSDADRVHFRLKSRGDQNPIVDARGKVVDPEQGHVAYEWRRKDLDVQSSLYDAAFKIRFTDRRTLVAPTEGRLVISVRESPFDD